MSFFLLMMSLSLDWPTRANRALLSVHRIALAGPRHQHVKKSVHCSPIIRIPPIQTSELRIQNSVFLDICMPALSATDRAQRNPSQLILVFGSVPFRIAARMVVVLSIQPPPRKAF